MRGVWRCLTAHDCNVVVLSSIRLPNGDWKVKSYVVYKNGMGGPEFAHNARWYILKKEKVSTWKRIS